MTATGRPRPGLRTRLAAAMHHEVDAATVEAYRQAGAAACQDQLDAEQVRTDLVLAGRSLWTARPDQASQLLCAWNAFALQTLGDALVEADYRADPHTDGYLPSVTAQQAIVFLSEVEHWSAWAGRPPVTRPTTSRPRSPSRHRFPRGSRPSHAPGRTWTRCWRPARPCAVGSRRPWTT